MSPEIVRRLNLPVMEQVPIQLSTFGNDSMSCLLDLVRVKVQFRKHRFSIKLLVHDQASMELNYQTVRKSGLPSGRSFHNIRCFNRNQSITRH